MAQTIEIGSTVKMSKEYLNTLSPSDKRSVGRKTYTVVNTRTIGSTVHVDLVDAQGASTSTTAGWLETK